MRSEITSNKPLGKKTKRGVLWSFLNEGVTEILFFPASMIVARILTPREFGVAAAASFFTLLAARLSELGFNAALIRTKELKEEHLSTVFIVNLVVGALTFGVLVALSPLVSRFYKTPEAGAILPVAALGYLIVPFGAIPAALLSRELRFRETAMVDWFYTAAFALVTTVAAWLGCSYMSMVYGRLAALLAMTISRQAYAPWRPRLAFSAAALREIFAFGAGVHAKRLLDYTTQNIDNLVVGRVFGMAALGLYDKAFSTMNRFLVRMNTGGPGLTFRVFSVINNEPERFCRAYEKVVLSTALIAFPVFGVLMVVAPQLMTVLFGPNWIGAAAPFQVLCLAGCLKLLNTYASSAIQAAGRVWGEVWRQATTIVLIVLGLLALRAWGPVGAAVGVLGATLVNCFLMHGLVVRVTHLRWISIIRPLVPASVCAGIVMLLVAGVQHAVQVGFGEPRPFVLLATQAAAAALFYVAFLLFAPIAGVRLLIREVAEDLAPAVVRDHRWVQAYLNSALMAPTSQSSSAV
jgi:PST family polysaccharide transporter